MNTGSIVEFLIAFVVIMIVALPVQIIQIKERLHDMPGGALKS
jgi:hypothetical protein